MKFTKFTMSTARRGLISVASISMVVMAIVVMAMGAVAEPATVSSSGPSNAEPGETVTISFTLTNTGGNASGYILDVSLPSEWTVVSHSDDGGSWQSSDNDWLWRTINPGDSVTVSVTVKIPSDASDGEYTISGVAKSSEGIEDTTSHAIVVEEAGLLSQYERDDDGNQVIDNQEIFTAIDDWQAGQLTNEEIFRLIDAWQTQEQV